jgi:hypothetical protein
MAFSELEMRRCERDLARFIERRRPPPHIRQQLDLGYRLEGQSVELFEIRPHWDGRSGKLETPVAKATFVRAQNVWRIYWMRQDLRWHAYEPNPEVQSLEKFLAIVDRDEYCCLFG